MSDVKPWQSNAPCSRCGRPSSTHYTAEYSFPLEMCVKAAYMYAVHDFYGCDTGCCGHVWRICDASGNVLLSRFEFVHPYGVPTEEFLLNLMGAISERHRIPIRYDLCKVERD